MSEDDDQAGTQAQDDAPVATEQSTAQIDGEAIEAGTGEDADGEAAEGDEAETQESEQPRKRPSGYERLKRKLEATTAELEIERSRAPKADDSAGIEAAVTKEIGAPPKEADFNGDWFAYQNAMSAYEVDKRQVTRDVRRRAEQAGAQHQAHMREVVDDFNERKADTAKRVPDFDAVVAKAAEARVASHVGRLILESEKGPLLQYHFAKNPDQLTRLNDMGPVSAAKEIGRLEARLSLPKANTATKASAPLTSPKGGAAPGFDPGKASAGDIAARLKKAGLMG